MSPAARPTAAAPGTNGQARGTPPAFVEHRRFRTWESDTHAVPTQRWKVVLRYGFLRTVRTWYLSVLLALFAIQATIGLVAFSYSATNGVRGDEFGGVAAAFLLPSALFVLLVGAPLLAEDVRFNAPLFYFSRPLRTTDYLLGKVAHLFGLLLVTGIVPVVLLSLVLLLLGVHEVPLTYSDGAARSAADLANARAGRIDTFGEGLLAVVLALLGALASTFFVGSAMVLFSSFTRRAWHAAMAFVAVLGSWSLLGVFMTELTQGATQNLFGPAGWMYLVLGAPFDALFRSPGTSLRDLGLEGIWAALPIAYLLLAGLGAACLHAADRRLRRLEGLL